MNPVASPAGQYRGNTMQLQANVVRRADGTSTKLREALPGRELALAAFDLVQLRASRARRETHARKSQ